MYIIGFCPLNAVKGKQSCFRLLPCSHLAFGPIILNPYHCEVLSLDFTEPWILWVFHEPQGPLHSSLMLHLEIPFFLLVASPAGNLSRFQLKCCSSCCFLLKLWSPFVLQYTHAFFNLYSLLIMPLLIFPKLGSYQLLFLTFSNLLNNHNISSF